MVQMQQQQQQQQQQQLQQQYTYMNSPPMLYNSPPMSMGPDSVGAAGPEGPPMHPEDDYNGQFTNHLALQYKTNIRHGKREVVSLKNLRTFSDKASSAKRTAVSVSEEVDEVDQTAPHSDSDHEDGNSTSSNTNKNACLDLLIASDSGCVSDVSSGVGDDSGRADNNENSDSLSQQSRSRSPSTSSTVETSNVDSSAPADTSSPLNKTPTSTCPMVNHKIGAIGTTMNPINTNTPILSKSSLTEVRPFKMNPVRQYQQSVNLPHRVSTRVVRPIKEIPPRFMKMLTPKHKPYRPYQFEGQPLLQNLHQKKCHPMMDSEVVVGGRGYAFNPNAESFVPGQLYDEHVSYDQSSNNSGCSLSGVSGGSGGSGGYSGNGSMKSDCSLDACVDVVSPSRSPTYTIVMNSNPSVYPDNGVMCFNSVNSTSPSTGYYSPSGTAQGPGQVYYPTPAYTSHSYVPCTSQSGNNQHQHTQVVYNNMPPMQTYTNVNIPPNMPAHNSQYAYTQ